MYVCFSIIIFANLLISSPTSISFDSNVALCFRFSPFSFFWDRILDSSLTPLPGEST
uniref:Uncharacterized protein n=1 Tax=Helianthus annuus TaxID=4232 RepID=A0A251VQF4_HELAN